VSLRFLVSSQRIGEALVGQFSDPLRHPAQNDAFACRPDSSRHRRGKAGVEVQIIVFRAAVSQLDEITAGSMLPRRYHR
jgi:hypothetical protein